MTEIYADSIPAAGDSGELTVTPLAIHGINVQCPAVVVAKNTAGGEDSWCELKRLEAGEAAIIYPTSATIKVHNLHPAAANDVLLIAE